MLHVPPWAGGTVIAVNEATQPAPRPGTFYAIDRRWADGDAVRIEFPMHVRIEGGHEGLLSVYRGPLLFGLHLGEKRTKIRGESPHCDYEIRPTTPWNYGLLPNLENPAASFRVETAPGARATVGRFRAAGAAFRSPRRRLPQWTLVDNSAGPVTGCAAGDRPARRASRVGPLRFHPTPHRGVSVEQTGCRRMKPRRKWGQKKGDRHRGGDASCAAHAGFRHGASPPDPFFRCRAVWPRSQSPFFRRSRGSIRLSRFSRENHYPNPLEKSNSHVETLPCAPS